MNKKLMGELVRITYLTADTVADILSKRISATTTTTTTTTTISSSSFSANATTPRTLIVDVRDPYEYVRGHIIGAYHLPSTRWSESTTVNDFLATHLPNYDRFIFHCQMSQMRGPTCARICAETLEDYVRDGLISRESLPGIYILRGGFREFNNRFGSRTDLVEREEEGGEDY
eukprot:gene4540-4978_t